MVWLVRSPKTTCKRKDLTDCLPPMPDQPQYQDKPDRVDWKVAAADANLVGMPGGSVATARSLDIFGFSPVLSSSGVDPRQLPSASGTRSLMDGNRPSPRRTHGTVAMDAMCVQPVDAQCILQFTLRHAVCCGLRRPTSQVIHR